MDSDLWIARLAAAKRHYASQLQHTSSSQSERIGIDEFEVDDEIRPEFPCPYCYEDHDVASLCAHLEEEHPFEPKVAVCPVCSDKINRDMLSHLTLQHARLFKTRRRLRRFVIPSSQAISLLSRDLRDSHLQVLLGGSGNNIRSNNNSNMNESKNNKNNIPTNIASDPLLSSLVLNFSPSVETEEVSKSSLSVVNEICGKEIPKHKWKSSYDASLTYEEREQKRKQAADKAKFVQDLILSTLF